MSQLGVNLKYLRKKKGLSQVELGQIAGITERTIYNYEVGDKYPKPRILKSLAEALEVPEELLEKGRSPGDFQNLHGYDLKQDTAFLETSPKKIEVHHPIHNNLSAESSLLEQINNLFANDGISELAKDEIFESIAQSYFLAKKQARLRKKLFEQ